MLMLRPITTKVASGPSPSRYASRASGSSAAWWFIWVLKSASTTTAASANGFRNITFLQWECPAEIRRVAVNLESTRRHSLFRGHRDRQRFIFNFDGGGGSLCLFQGFGSDRHNRVSEIPDTVFAEDRLVRHNGPNTIGALNVIRSDYRTTPGMFWAAEISTDLSMAWCSVLRTTAICSDFPTECLR